MSAEAGNLPALSTFARSMASFNENEPVISDLPPDIAPLLTPGAEYTKSSKTIAILLASLNALPVKFSHIREPLESICMDTAG